MSDDRQWWIRRVQREPEAVLELQGYGCREPVDGYWEAIRFIQTYGEMYEQAYKHSKKGK
jgi:hypothetical protein